MPHNPLFSVYTGSMLAVGGGTCLLAALCLGAIGLFSPAVLNNEISKWVACIIFSLTLAIPFFIVWPHNSRAAVTLSGWNIAGLAGPIVLFVVLFLLLINSSPNVAGATRFIAIELRDNDGNLLSQSQESLEFSTQGSVARIDKVIDSSDPENNTLNLHGIVIQFPNQLEVKVRVTSPISIVTPELITLNAKTEKIHLTLTRKKRQQRPD